MTTLVGVVLDVTDRIRNEQELQRSEERYRELFENANDIIYTHDLAGKFTSINKAAERVLGYSHDEVLRLNVRDVVAPEQVEIGAADDRAQGRRRCVAHRVRARGLREERPPRDARGEYAAHPVATARSSACRASPAT